MSTNIYKIFQWENLCFKLIVRLYIIWKPCLQVKNLININSCWKDKCEKLAGTQKATNCRSKKLIDTHHIKKMCPKNMSWVFLPGPYSPEHFAVAGPLTSLIIQIIFWCKLLSWSGKWLSWKPAGRHMYLDAWYIVPSYAIVFNWLIFLFDKEYFPAPGCCYRVTWVLWLKSNNVTEVKTAKTKCLISVFHSIWTKVCSHATIQSRCAVSAVLEGGGGGGGGVIFVIFPRLHCCDCRGCWLLGYVLSSLIGK